MRVLFTTWNSPSHLYPMVPLIWACVGAGHEVRVAGPPSCEPWITRAGLPAVVVGHDLAAGGELTQNALRPLSAQSRWPADWMVKPDELDATQLGLLEKLAVKNFAVADAMLGDLTAFARGWRPDLVVYDTTCYAGAVVAAAVGVPAVSHMWGTGAPVRNEMAALGSRPLPEYTALFERHGAPARPDPLAWIDPCPPSMQLPFPGRRLTAGFVPYNGGGEVPAWLLEPPARPRVCLSWGVVTGRISGSAASDELMAAIEAVAGLDVDLVIATAAAPAGFADGLPAGVRVVESIPLNTWLPSCSAVVHHGGGGTTLVATWAGVPQLVISQRPVYALTGDRLVAVSAGRHRTRDELAAGDAVRIIREDVAALLDQSAYRAVAGALRDEMLRQPSPAELLPVIEKLVAAG